MEVEDYDGIIDKRKLDISRKEDEIRRKESRSEKREKEGVNSLFYSQSRVSLPLERLCEMKRLEKKADRTKRSPHSTHSLAHSNRR